MLDFDQPLTVAPTFGVGWFGQSALLAHRDGLDFCPGLHALQRSNGRRPGSAVVLHLHDDVAKLRLDLTLKLDPRQRRPSRCSRCCTTWADAAIDVQWLAAGTLLLPGQADAVRSYAGQHVHEFMLQTDPLTRSLWRKESRRGPHQPTTVFPGARGHHARHHRRRRAVLRRAPGLVGQTTSRPSSGCTTAFTSGKMGEWLAPGEGRLQPGQSLTTPRADRHLLPPPA